MIPKELLKAFNKTVPHTTFADKNYLNPKYYISTGNYAVNKIISGSMFRGIPNNRITAFYGESGCVPFDSKVYVLVKTDVEISEVLEHIPSDSNFESMFDNMSISDKINMLIEIGYTQVEISRRTGISRQSIYINRTKTPSKRNSTGENSVYYRVNTLLKKNIYMMPMHGIKLLHYKKAKFLILTPYGFRRCSNLIDKGEKESYVITVTDCPTSIVSKDHLVELDNGKFEFAENIYNEHKVGYFKPMIKTVNGPKSLLNIREGGLVRMCDVEIEDEHHSYFANDISGHNSGKSLIVSEIIINAIKENDYDVVYYLDSEGGVLTQRYESHLTEDELQKIRTITVGSIEECTSTLNKIYDMFKEAVKLAKDDETKMPKALVVLDSFSGLKLKSFADKAIKDNVAADMGAEAKAKNAMIKSMMIPVVTTGCPLVVICHSYKNTNAMGPQKFDIMSGGEGIKYASHIVVQSKAARKRQEDSSLGLKAGGSYYAQNLIRYATAKNRLVVEGLEATMVVDYVKGIQKYAGLWDDAIRLGFIKQLGAWYQVPSWSEPEKKFRKDDIIENDEIWATFINKMDEVFKYETSYVKEGKKPEQLNNVSENIGMILSEEDALSEEV